jgi:transposase
MEQNSTRGESPKEALEVLPESPQQSPEQSPRESEESGQEPMAIGVNLGDRTSRYCMLNESGEVVKKASVATTKKGLTQVFGALKRSRIVIEVGKHSRWVSRLLTELGHEVFTANPQEMELISQSIRKNDRIDAQTLARLVRANPELLRPIPHYSEEMQMELMTIQTRKTLVEARSILVDSVRELAESVGERLPQCDASIIGSEQFEALPQRLRDALEPLLEEVEAFTVVIEKYDRKIEQMVEQRIGQPDSCDK